MEIKEVTAEEFKKYQNNFKSSNFIQTAEYGKVLEAGILDRKVSYILFVENEVVVGCATVVYKSLHRIFKEALVAHGPLFNYEMKPKIVLEGIEKLTEYMRHKKVDRLTLLPYLAGEIRDDRLELKESYPHESLCMKLEEIGYLDKGSKDTVYPAPNRIFRKSLQEYRDTEDLFNSLHKSIKRHITKNAEQGVIIRQGDINDSEIFFRILKGVGERKGFGYRNLEYWKTMISAFGDKKILYMGHMDLPKICDKLMRDIEIIDDKLIEVGNRKESNNKEKRLKSLNQQREDFCGKKSRLENINESLRGMEQYAAIIILRSPSEDVFFLGGNAVGAESLQILTSILWEAMKKAYEDGKEYFNFYGTFEMEDADSRQGNFNFKRLFGGELVSLIGPYVITLSGKLSWVEKILGK